MKRSQDTIIGNSSALADTLAHVSQLAAIDRPALVLGERGTGKELIAQRLHYLSPRWDGPLIKVNCAAIAESLLESELFGHEPGAFTGATRTHQGRFERADGGTLFLDELGTMSQGLQEKLLRLLEYGEFERLGGQRTLQVDVRVVAATNADLRDMSAREAFRPDLLDRLSFDVIHLPALRQRREDIPELTAHFATKLCAELGREWFAGFTEQAERELMEHSWPGNIRELKNVVERSIYRWPESDTAVDHIVIDPFQSPHIDEDNRAEFAEATTIEAQSSSEASAPATASSGKYDFRQHLNDIEKTLLSNALAEHQQNQRLTADALQLSYDQLRGLVRKHHLSTRSRR